MKIILLILLAASVILAAGCTNTPDMMPAPTGKGYLNLCLSDPGRAGYWQNSGEVLWNLPGNDTGQTNRVIVAGFPSCDNLSVTIWENRPGGSAGWKRVTLRTKDGRVYDGWLDASHITASNETGTEWSKNYFSIVGLWYQTGRGNGAPIWYDFKADGTFTFNYDMRGNKDNVQERGSWEYLGDKMYQLTSNFSHDPATAGNAGFTLDPGGKTFISGTEYTQYANGLTMSRELVYKKE